MHGPSFQPDATSLAQPRFRLVMLTLLGAFVTSCNAEPPAPARALEDARVSRPGQVLFPRRQRAEELASLPLELRRAWCPPYLGAAPAAVSGLRRSPNGPDTASEPFALAAMKDAGASVAGDESAMGSLIQLLGSWARADALRAGDRRAANRNYALDRTLLPTIVAFAIIRDDPVLASRMREHIQSWLASLVDSRRRPNDGDVTSRNNHHYLRGSVDIAWGALTGEDASFRAGVDAYRDALRAMRDDGSLPLETARGARALWYQRHAIASLVVMAEIATNQGLDLYGLQVKGHDLHTAIRFLLDGIDDPARVLPYARADEKPGSDRAPVDQDLSFLDTRGHDRHYMAWVEIYAARFPDRPESRRLLALLADRDPGFRPMIDDYSGGAATCLFARP